MRFLLMILALACAPVAEAGAKVPASPAQITLSFAPVVRKAAPAVVNIYVQHLVAQQVSPFTSDPFFQNLFRNFGQMRPRVQNSLGSGVILSPDGIVVSNYHVVGQATKIRVVLTDRREFRARVLLADKQSDLAVLKLVGAHALPSLSLRDSDAVAVGDLVLAIGNPFGVGQTVSSGIISGLARSGIGTDSGRGYFLQTDAPINPGNSGGALVDMSGRLVGINTSILTRSGGSNGIGFAIPANLVAQFVAQAKAGKRHFVRPWAGVTAQAIDAALANSLGLPVPEGVIIAKMHRLSPFVRAGFKTGDVILSVAGRPVNTPAEMAYHMAVRGVGKSIAVAAMRAGKLITRQVSLIPAPEIPPRQEITLGRNSPFAGLKVANLSPALAAELGMQGTDRGVVIEKPGAILAQVGLRAKDILLRIDYLPVARTRDVVRLIRAGNRQWQFEVLRNGKRFVSRFRL